MTLLQMSLSGAALTAAVALMRALLLRRVPKRTFLVLWLVVLLRLLIPFEPVIHVALPRLVPEPARTETAASAIPAQPAAQSPRPAAESAEPTLRPAPVPTAPDAPRQRETRGAPSRETVLTVLWGAGAMATGAFFVLGYARGYRRFRRAAAADGEAARAWREAHPLRRDYAIRVCDALDSPMTYGVLRPVILVPAGFRWERSEAKYALEHEYVHMRRFDAALKLALALALTLHWFNPAIWGLYVLANRDIELSCDEAVLRRFGAGERGAYARALLAAEEHRRMSPLCAGFGANTTRERIVEIMKFRNKSVLSLLLAVAMVALLAACAASGGKQETDAGGDSQEAPAPFGQNGNAGFLNGGIVLNVPSEATELVLVDMPQDDPDGMLFRVSEKASVEAGEADGHDASWGDGWLFGIRRVNADTLHEMLCYDMSGADVFAKDADDNYYIFTHPTDVRLYRSDDSYEQAMEQWTALNTWAWDDVRADILTENSALEPFERGNSMLDMYLARAAYQPDADYVLSTTEFGPLAPNGVDAAPYAERLMSGNGVVYEGADVSETPDGEYVVLSFPADNVRFEFFRAAGGYVRTVWGDGSVELTKLTLPDGAEASGVAQEWYDELAAAEDMSLLGYTPDDLVGRWAEKMAGRGVITVEKTGDGVYGVSIDWRDSANRTYVWEMTATPVGNGGMLRYSDARLIQRTFTSDTEYTDEVQYENGSGRLYLNSAFEIMWEDDVADAGANCVFVNVD